MTTVLNMGPPLREWTLPAGELTVALSPFLLAVNEELKHEGVTHPKLSEVDLRWHEYADGSRLLPKGLLAEIYRLDREQRENGYDGPRLVSEVSGDE